MKLKTILCFAIALPSFIVAEEPVAPSSPSAEEVADIASRAVARRQEMIAKADEAALRGMQMMAEADRKAATSGRPAYRSHSAQPSHSNRDKSFFGRIMNLFRKDS